MNAELRCLSIVLLLAVVGCGSDSETPAANGSKSTDTHSVDRATTSKSPFDGTTSGVSAVQQPKVVTPDAAVVKKHMAPGQLALGDPVVNSIGMLLVPIPSGEFLMGSPDSDKDANDYEKPQHLVKLTKPFYLGVFEVTQQQYEKVMGDRPWQGKDDVQVGTDYPATYVSWHDAVEFCRKLSEKESVDYRLPTETEWEYACRAGTTTDYSFGDDVEELGNHAWYEKNTWRIGEEYAHRVGQKVPNPWGLYDMHGNVWESCQDTFRRYGSKKNAGNSAQSMYVMCRGGSLYSPPDSVRSAYRTSVLQSGDPITGDGGFRVIKTYDVSP